MSPSASSETPLIAVDIGNSSLHLGRFLAAAPSIVSQPDDVASAPTHGEDWSALEAWAPHGPSRWRVVSVHRDAERRLAAWVAKHRPEASYRQLFWTDLPIEVKVAAPERVGMDRLAAAAAANVLRDPSRPAVVIDSGTAITVDWVDERGAFLGGAILPGMRMAAAALAGGTDLLPRLAIGQTPEAPRACGDSTEAAIRSGIHWGAVGAVRRLIGQMSREFRARPQVFVSGGDGRRIAPWLGRSAIHVPNIVLCGVSAASR